MPSTLGSAFKNLISIRIQLAWNVSPGHGHCGRHNFIFRKKYCYSGGFELQQRRNIFEAGDFRDFAENPVVNYYKGKEMKSQMEV